MNSVPYCSCVLSGNMLRAINAHTHMKLSSIEHIELSTNKLIVFTKEANRIPINYHNL